MFEYSIVKTMNIIMNYGRHTYYLLENQSSISLVHRTPSS